MNWKIKNNLIDSVTLNGDNLILPWGIETADSSGFFSLDDSFGYRYQLLSQCGKSDNQSNQRHLKVQMPEGKWALDIDESVIGPFSIRRRASLYCLEESRFMDFVLRFRFKKEFFREAEINETVIPHKNTNVYHQYPVNQARLEGERYRVALVMEEAKHPDCFSAVMYVRDHPDEWVVHARLIPNQWDKEVIKLCNPWAKTRPIPQFLSHALLSFPSVKNALWYRGERKPFQNRILKRINPQACAITKIPKESLLSLTVRVDFKDRTND